MTTYLKSGFAAAIIASTALAGSAYAQTVQYEPYAESPPSIDDTRIDTMTTRSIYPSTGWSSANIMADTYIDGSQDTGDFYDGAMRPTN